MGELQKEILIWLGNKPSKIIPLGLPRLDQSLPKACRFGSPGASAELIVATANTPWFSDEQKSTFIRKFGALVVKLEEITGSNLDSRLGVSWRVPATVTSEFDLTSDRDRSLSSALLSCDALITTPSTLAVEAMLLGIPTLVFDPYASPNLLPSVWFASEVDTIVKMLPSLLEPTEWQASFQDALLRLTVPESGNSARNIRDLIFSVVNGTGFDKKRAATASAFTKPAEKAPLSELDGLVATIPALESLIVEKQEIINNLRSQLKRPSLRTALGALYRSLTHWL